MKPLRRYNVLKDFPGYYRGDIIEAFDNTTPKAGLIWKVNGVEVTPDSMINKIDTYAEESEYIMDVTFQVKTRDIELSTNLSVTVYPTERGLNIMRSTWETAFKAYPHEPFDTYIQEDRTVKMPLHELMCNFGHMFYVGNDEIPLSKILFHDVNVV